MALIQSAKTIRPIYQPLTVSCTIKADPTKTPIVQEMIGGTYNPDRTIQPTILQPTVSCIVSDGSLADLSTGNGNNWITAVKWLLNGADIADAVTAGTLSASAYTIDTNPGPTCGQLTLGVNVQPGTVWTLQFQATLIDPRGNGQQQTILSDQLELTTLVSADDRIRIVMDTEDAISYDPLRDLQLLDDYCAANGFTADRPSSSQLAAARHRSYRHTFPVRIISAGKLLPLGTDHLLRVYAVTSTTETLLDPDQPDELQELTYNTDGTATVTLDLSIISNRGYLVKAVTSSGNVVAVKHIGVLRRPVALRIETVNGCSLLPGHDARADQVIAHDMRGNLVKHPELYMDIAFYGDPVGDITEATINSGQSVLLGTGRKAQYRLSAIGIDHTNRSAILRTAVSTEERGAFAYLTDESGNYLTDETGDNYLATM